MNPEQPIPTPQEAVAKIMSAFLGAILQAGGSLPNGHLYAAVMGHFDIVVYEALINKMIELGYITMSNHLLTATDQGRAFEKETESS